MSSTGRGRRSGCSAIGSWVVRQVSGTEVPDTTSGFRAYTREAALRMSIVSEFSYTLESIIQAGKRRMAIAHVEVATNARTRPSRLFDSLFAYIKKSAATIVRIYMMYEPLKVFTYLGSIVFLAGFAISLRFLYFYFFFPALSDGKIQSLILSAVLMLVGFQVVMIGLVADAISGTRKLLEDVLYRVRRLELDRAAGSGRAAGALMADPGSRLDRHSRLQRIWRDCRRRPRTARSRRRPGARSWSSTTARPTTRPPRPRRAGARVVRHPYNKGNGAAVKTGIRTATGEYILIIDADGQHQPADALRLTSRLGEYDLVVGARSKETQAGSTRRFGNAALNRLASFLTEREIPDLTSGFRAARREYLLEFLPLLPNGFSTPTTTTLAFLKAGYNVLFEPIEARPRVGTSKIRLVARRARSSS